MFVRVSLQLPGYPSGAATGHLASGALRDDDLVLVPNVDASVLRHQGPYVAVVVLFAGGGAGGWEVGDPAIPADDPAPYPVRVEWIRCHCEEVHSVDGDTFQAAFRLEMPSTGDRLQIGVEALLATPQDEVWPEAAAVLKMIRDATSPTFPSTGGANKVVLHLVAAERSSWCRFVPWC